MPGNRHSYRDLFDGLLQLVDRLLARDVPVDAIGFQMHVFSSFNQFDELSTNMAAMAERGLDIHITELDVAIAAGDNDATQANVDSQVIERCQEQPRCKVLQTWGLYRSVFIPNVYYPVVP